MNKFTGRALAACCLALLATACGAVSQASHQTPIERACSQLVAADPLDHPSYAGCVRCEIHGSEYMWFDDPGNYECDDPQW
jgi:hypothetical protein